MRRCFLAILACIVVGLSRTVIAGAPISEAPCDTFTAQDHAWALDQLNGRTVVFIGDSRVRFQYLQLAYFVVHARCPDKTSPDYILTYGKHGFKTFFETSSRQLNSKTDSHSADETCICHRTELRPGKVEEHRVFTYSDIQVNC